MIPWITDDYEKFKWHSLIPAKKGGPGYPLSGVRIYTVAKLPRMPSVNAITSRATVSTIPSTIM